MRSVDRTSPPLDLAKALADMRQWLDHNDCTPTIFRTRTAQPGAVLVQVEFEENDAAAAFERRFAEHLMIAPTGVNSVSADPLEKMVEAA